MSLEKTGAIDLLMRLIKKPSVSGEEGETASIIFEDLTVPGVKTIREGNNVLSWYRGAPGKPFIVLCSHHDTVRANSQYTRDPFCPEIEGGKLFGLGSNDAGGALVSLMAAFKHFVRNNIEINLLFVAVAEEEISGKNGIESILHLVSEVDLAIIGEPTKMQMATCEKGLIVVDGVAQGVPGHAAHENTVNPILTACEDIHAIHSVDFAKVSPYLGKTKASVTVIQGGRAHNQVPASCTFTIDVRVNEMYSLNEVLEILQSVTKSTLTARSLRLRPSKIDNGHTIIKVAQSLSIPIFGSATLSDQALLPFPSVKIGPGDTLRSHIADEYIFVEEINDGIDKYISLISTYWQSK